MRDLATMLVAVLAVAGCVAPSVAPTGTPLEAPGVSGPWVAVALLDTGIHPWHEAFRLPPMMGEPPAPAERIPLAFRETLAAEGPSAWNTLEKGKLYWFEGTRVLAISFTLEIPDEFGMLADPHLIYDDAGHGTATASVVARTSPEAWIVMVEMDGLNPDGFAWVAEQPWIDVLSISAIAPAHLPNMPGPEPATEQYRESVLRGKITVNGGGNDPSPRLLDWSSAPWTIGVGGAEGSQRGTTPLTSQPVDVVADLTVDGLADHASDDGTYTAKGTSFGTPIVAGVLAEGILRLRTQVGHEGGIRDGALVHAGGTHLTNLDFRRALNLSAAYWATTDHRPAVNASQTPTYIPYDATLPGLPHVERTPVGPWLQMGWGYVEPATVTALVGILDGTVASPDKADAARHMEQLHAFREALWETWTGGGT